MDAIIQALASINLSKIPWDKIGTGVLTIFATAFAEISRRNAAKTKHDSETIDSTVLGLISLVNKLSKQVEELQKLVAEQRGELYQNALLIKSLEEKVDSLTQTNKQLIELLRTHDIQDPFIFISPISLAKD